MYERFGSEKKNKNVEINRIFNLEYIYIYQGSLNIFSFKKLSVPDN